MPPESCTCLGLRVPRLDGRSLVAHESGKALDLRVHAQRTTTTGFDLAHAVQVVTDALVEFDNLASVRLALSIDFEALLRNLWRNSNSSSVPASSESLPPS